MDIDIQKQQLIDDTLGRICEMKRLYLVSEAQGNDTLERLAEQGDKLDEINRDLSALDSTVIQAKKNITRLKRFRQRLVDFLQRASDRFSSLNCLAKPSCVSYISLKRYHTIPRIFDFEATIDSASQCNIDERDIDELQMFFTNRLKNLGIIIKNELNRQNGIINGMPEQLHVLDKLIEKCNSDIRKLLD